MVGGHRRLRIRHTASAFVGILALAAAAITAGAQHPPKIHPPEPKKPEQKEIHGEGCVKAGVQAHCIVLRDLKTGHLYDLLFKGDRPPVGLGIEFTGVLHHGATACMQGTPVDVTKWAHKASIKCAPGQAGKP